ncbi:MAG: carbohydrate-binding domain-containing protein, partial [Oscillospiraceae bacterium]
MKRIVSGLTVFLIIIALFAGCSAQSGTAAQSASDSTGTAASLTVSNTSGDEMFSDRDKEIGYSESESTIISLADGASSANGDGAEVKNDTVTITKEGTYILSGRLSNGQIVVDAADDAKIQIVLNGTDITNESSAAIYVKNADKVFITTASGAENTLSVTGEFVQTDDNNVDGAIFAKSDLTLNGAGSLTVVSKYGHGVVSKDDLVITSGTYDISSAKQGLSGKNSVRIADGTFTIEAGTDGIHSENEDDTTLGFVYIAGGTMSVSAEKQGIQGTSSVAVTGGKIEITKSYEGIEGLAINISGGEISIVSSDDGLNSASSDSQSGDNQQNGGPQGGGMAAVDGCEISISGGTLNVNASGDGIDSNGSLTISGGTITVSGPTENNNNAIDYAGTAEITGGTVLAAGSSGMAQGFSDSSTQCSILYNLSGSQKAGTKVTLKDESGNVLAEFTPAKQFQSVNISLPTLKSGSTYT